MRLYPADHPEHLAAADLLPWYVNGTLQPAEAALVERHLGSCLACKQDIEGLKALQAWYNEERARCESLRSVTERAPTPPERQLLGTALQHSTGWRARLQWWQVLLFAQSALIALLIVAFIVKQEPHYYHTLSSARSPVEQGAAIVVVFDAKVEEGRIRALLQSLHAHIIDGPTQEGAYSLRVAEGDAARVIAQLRQRAWVRLAEPAQ
jgi:anti-sigma factor RsiW